MPIVFSSFVPHPPVLIPEIGKENLDKLKKTKQAYEKLEQELYAAKPDSLILISPHGNIIHDSFNINLNSDYLINFKDFGEYSLEQKFKSDFMTIQQIRASDEASKSVPFVLSSQEEIDHGFAVPLYYLTPHLKNLPIIPITYSGLDYQSHFVFGQFLHRTLSRINKRFAVIASGDLSHRLIESSPAGYAPEGKKFDKKVQDLIKAKDFNGLMNLDQKLVQAAGECGMRSLMILLGMIESLDFEPEILSYEGPFGIGYLVCNFKIS